jgi:hypothetical protein
MSFCQVCALKEDIHDPEHPMVMYKRIKKMSLQQIEPPVFLYREDPIKAEELAEPLKPVAMVDAGLSKAESGPI